MKLTRVALYTADLNHALEFYQELLEFEIEELDSSHVSFKDGLELTTNPYCNALGNIKLTFETIEFEKLLYRLSKHNDITVLSLRVEEERRTLTLLDLDGNTIRIVDKKDNSLKVNKESDYSFSVDSCYSGAPCYFEEE